MPRKAVRRPSIAAGAVHRILAGMTNARPMVVELLRHNLWANTEMLAACRGLRDEQFETEVLGTFGRLSQTLIHLARAQGGYLRTLADWQPGPEHRLEASEPFPGIDRIAEHLRLTGERLIEVAKHASADRDVEGTWNGQPYRFPEWVVLLQAAHHATEHRQQIATALTYIGIEPPEPDIWPTGSRSRPRGSRCPASCGSRARCARRRRNPTTATSPPWDAHAPPR